MILMLKIPISLLVVIALASGLFAYLWHKKILLEILEV